ncbi:hypothetical protein Bca101_067939 [Brassica carinata]
MKVSPNMLDAKMGVTELLSMRQLGQGGKRKYKSRKGKEAAGASEHVGVDGVDPTALLPTAVVTANIETGLPADHFVPDEVRVDEAGRQLEQELGPADGARGRPQRE